MTTFAESINKALHETLKDPRTILMGEGVPDPKRIFGTTKGLKEAYPNQVFDQPVSENGATGVLIGAAIQGFRCIQTHQRIDFSLYAMDQIINNAAKWTTMFGGNGGNVNLTIRMIVGRGWGQGVQHSQNLEALYAHIPGLKVFVPHDPESAHRLLLEAINDPDPVIFIEHKWIYNKKQPTYKPRWKDPKLTIVSWGAASSEVSIALQNTEDIDHIVLEKLSDDELDPVFQSVQETRKLLVVSDDWERGSYASEIITGLVELPIGSIEVSRIGFPNHYVPASPSRSRDFYPEAAEILARINNFFLWTNYSLPEKRKIHDVDPFSTGPTSAI